MADEDNLIDAISNRIKSDRDKLKDVGLERIEVDSFNLTEFWPQLESAVQLLSKEVTKVGFICGNKPFPKKTEVGNMLRDVLQCYNMMLELYLLLPEEVGAEVFKATTTAVMNIMTSLLDIVNSFNDLTEKGSKDRLILTSTFWDACAAVEKLPKNNLLAIMKLFEEESALASDALEELKVVNKNMNKIPDECDKSKSNSEDRAVGKEKASSGEGSEVLNQQVDKNTENNPISLITRSDLQLAENKSTVLGTPQSEMTGISNTMDNNDLICFMKDQDLKNWMNGCKATRREMNLATLQHDIDTCSVKIENSFAEEYKMHNKILHRQKRAKLLKKLKTLYLAKEQFEKHAANGTLQKFISYYAILIKKTQGKGFVMNLSNFCT